MVIGTEEWYKKWHVGLADSSSESESEKVSETYSDSESGDDLPKDLVSEKLLFFIDLPVLKIFVYKSDAPHILFIVNCIMTLLIFISNNIRVGTC